MNKIFLCSNENDINRVYDARVREKLDIGAEIYNRDKLKANKKKLTDVRYVFSTWGMVNLTGEEIKAFLPSLEAVFYAAGTVGYFAEPFLKSGVKVFSAAYANGIPVAEYTVSQIVLASKGFFRAEKAYRGNLELSRKIANSVQGNYFSTVGLIGLGVIGAMVAERLKAFDVTVLAYDPFVSEERAESLGVKLVSLETLFEKCGVVSNHLANKAELNDLLGYELFGKMKKDAVFINTGRGAQVNEHALARALNEEKERCALLDVLKDENNPAESPLFACDNAFITPHMAGSMGYEVTRMADFIISEFELYLAGGKCSSEVTLEKLKTMA